MTKRTAFGGLVALCLTTALALPALAGEVKVWTLTFSNDSANRALEKIIADF